MQVAGLTIHALDRIDVQRLAQARDVAVRVMAIYRTVGDDRPGRSASRCWRELHRAPGLTAELERRHRRSDLPEMLPFRCSGCCGST